MQRRENSGAFASQHDLQKFNVGTESCRFQKVEATNVYFNSGDDDRIDGNTDDGATEVGSEGGSGSVAAIGEYYLSSLKPLQPQKQNVINVVKCNDHHHGREIGGCGTLSSPLSPLRDEDIDIFTIGYGNGEVGSSSSALKKGGIHDSVDSFRAVFEQQLQVNEQTKQVPSSSSSSTAAATTKQLPTDPLSINNYSNNEGGSSSDSHDGYMDSPVTWDSPMTTTDGAASSNVSSHHNTSPLPPTVMHGMNMGIRLLPPPISSSHLPPHGLVSAQVASSSDGVASVSIGRPMTVDYNQLPSQSQPQPQLPPHQQPCLSSSSGVISSTLHPSQLQQQQHPQLPPQQHPQLPPPQQHPQLPPPPQQQMGHFHNGLAGSP